MAQEQKVKIDYFSDVLCIWAFISQKRLEALEEQFTGRVDVAQHFITLFGDTEKRIAEGWREKGGYRGFNQHVMDVAAQFPEVTIHPDVWLTNRPKSSATSHLFLKAVQLWDQSENQSSIVFNRIVAKTRTLFFEEAKDIGDLAVLLSMLEEFAVNANDVERLCCDGSAMAKLCDDLALKESLKLEGSPTFILNNGRQKLFGNVGYRIIEANINELFDQPEGMASWC